MEDRRRPEDLVGDPGKEKVMEEHIHRRSRIAIVVATIAIVAAACSPSSSSSPAASGPGASTGGSAAPSSAGGGDLAGQSVTVIGTWGGDEETAFHAMVAPWEAQTGAKVNYTGTRDLNTVLTTGVASGVLPDLAGLPGPGQMTQWADSLVDLGGVLDVPTYTSETAPALVTLGTVNSKLVGVFIKTAVKGLIWFDPKILTDVGATPPATWDALQTYITTNKAKAESPWCLGVESGAASGWPGTDWIEDIVLRQAGPDVYQTWYQGTTKWTDPAIKAAWTTFGDVVATSFGGSATVNATNFANAGDPLFKTPPGCMFLHQASFITGLGGFKTATAGTDYDFFQFPDINTQYTGAVEGAGDLFGMFHDTPAAKSLMAYLVTAPAQDIWVKIGGALSANKNATDYPDDISKRSAAILTNAKVFAFDASDLMPTAMNDAFWKGIVQYIKDPTQLDSILANLDTVQTDAYAAP
jgi:alpha-glucoside transport system substrate-binding protein